MNKRSRLPRLILNRTSVRPLTTEALASVQGGGIGRLFSNDNEASMCTDPQCHPTSQSLPPPCGGGNASANGCGGGGGMASAFCGVIGRG